MIRISALLTAMTLLGGCLLSAEEPALYRDTTALECHDLDCFPYACDEDFGSCNDDCYGDDDCAAGYYCCDDYDWSCYDAGFDYQCVEE